MTGRERRLAGEILFFVAAVAAALAWQLGVFG